MKDVDTIIITNSKTQNVGRGLILGGILAAIAGMVVIDKCSDNYTAKDSETRDAIGRFREELEGKVD